MCDVNHNYVDDMITTLSYDNDQFILETTPYRKNKETIITHFSSSNKKKKKMKQTEKEITTRKIWRLICLFMTITSYCVCFGRGVYQVRSDERVGNFRAVQLHAFMLLHSHRTGEQNSISWMTFWYILMLKKFIDRGRETGGDCMQCGVQLPCAMDDVLMSSQQHGT